MNALHATADDKVADTCPLATLLVEVGIAVGDNKRRNGSKLVTLLICLKCSIAIQSLIARSIIGSQVIKATERQMSHIVVWQLEIHCRNCIIIEIIKRISRCGTLNQRALTERVIIIIIRCILSGCRNLAVSKVCTGEIPLRTCAIAESWTVVPQILIAIFTRQLDLPWSNGWISCYRHTHCIGKGRHIVSLKGMYCHLCPCLAVVALVGVVWVVGTHHLQRGVVGLQRCHRLHILSGSHAVRQAQKFHGSSLQTCNACTLIQ